MRSTRILRISASEGSGDCAAVALTVTSRSARVMRILIRFSVEDCFEPEDRSAIPRDSLFQAVERVHLLLAVPGCPPVDRNCAGDRDDEGQRLESDEGGQLGTRLSEAREEEQAARDECQPLRPPVRALVSISSSLELSAM